MPNCKKGLSPAIASVILVAVSITLAAGVAIWIKQTSGEHAIHEDYEIQSIYSSWAQNLTNARWKISIVIKNKGDLPTTIMTALANDVPIKEYNISEGGALSDPDSTGTDIPASGIRIESGDTETISVWIGSNLYSSGTYISLKIYTVSGMSHIKFVRIV